jgi:broad specificity phosphatase PhoE
MRIYLLRHGETDWNVARRIQGRTDIALNSNGARQARSWQSYFSRVSLAGVYSSALCRAMETALLASHRAPCVVDGLNERNYGEWEGSLWGDLVRHNKDFDLRWRDPNGIPPGGESRLAMHSRVRLAMESIIASHDADSEILIVAHGGSGKAVLGFANRWSIEELSEIPALRNAGVTIIKGDRNRWTIEEEMSPSDIPILNL